MAKAFQEIKKWLEERIDYYNYEYRYSNSDKEKEVIDTKIKEATEILYEVEKVYNVKSLST